MLFTIGHTETYEKLFEDAEKDGEPLFKAGRSAGYPGGSIWPSRSLAQRYLDMKEMNNYSVYGVLADWSDVDYRPGAPFWDLVNARELVRLENDDD
jgi:hypothetical protein